MSAAALDALCSHLGIDPDYADAWGKRTDVPESSKRAIVAALGQALPRGDEDELATCLAQLRQADEQRVLPSVVVLETEGESGVLHLTPRLPSTLAGQSLRWRITLENGGERRGLALARPIVTATGSLAPMHEDEPPEILSMSLALAAPVPFGRHRLSLFAPGPSSPLLASAELFVCPATCFAAEEASEGKRLWGPSVQVYALRSDRDWGMGDLGDLRRLVDLAADAGAHFVGINPLHALFPHDPERASPYSPSSRQWLDVLYLDVENLRDFGECREARERVDSEAFRERLDALRRQPLIDYTGVAAIKFEVLELLYRHFRDNHLERATQRAGLFRDFQREGGRSLRLHALFDTLQETFHRQDASVWGWPAWPEIYRDAQGAAVEAFELDHEERIEFFEYLQWQAAGQLHAVAQRARARGMRVGLYRDLAVGVNGGGSETWAQPALYALAASTGAPPDELNPAGQDWGFPPALPQHLVEGGYDAFIAVLRANMRYAGALRLDHVMSLMRLFWLPGDGAVGAYVSYPMDDLFYLLCLESRRQRCIVIGEDLGIVPPAIRDAMAHHGILSYRPLYFERGTQGVFRAPSEWPRHALAAIGTHDLPTLRGYWTGFDLDLRDQFGIYRDPALRERYTALRGEEKGALLAALANEGLSMDAAQVNGAAASEPAPGLAPALYRFLARTPCLMTAVQLEDVLGQLQAVNLLGTREAEYANWRRKLESELADIAADQRWHAIVAAMNIERPCPPLPVTGGPRDFRPESAHIPRATYRLQFHSDFRFDAAEAVLPYLAGLGISHVYAAPFLKARPGSRHGYDIVDHGEVNPEIGTAADFDRYCARLTELGLSQVLDIVPNHVGVLGADNEWWLDVLENGPASEHAEHFDIDWDPPFAELRNKVLLPVLGDQYGLVLEAGELVLDFSAEHGEFSVRYFQHRFPIDPCDYPLLLADESTGGGSPAIDDAGLETLLAAMRNLPARNVGDPLLQAERRRNKEIFKKQLAELYERLPTVREQLQRHLDAFNGRVGEPASFDALNALLERQAYRLASWRVAADDINYRRFFDVNDLAALRVENEEVFEATHAQIFRWLAEGRVSGVRIDHPDGLSDPATYFERLQARYARIIRDAHPETDDAVPTPSPSLYIVVEKIIGEFEQLPADWPVHGDTGYRFANVCNNLFVDAAQESRFSRVYRAFTGEVRDFSEVLLAARDLIMTHSLPGELGGLAYLLHDIAQRDRRTRDFTRSRLRGALTEIVAGFPVYRSYISPRGLSDTDRRYIERAVEEAARRGLAGDASVLHFVREVLFSAPTEPVPALRRLKLGFARRFQQFTAPVMAKAMEDTAFYRYNRLISLNEVGGDPRTFGTAVEDFHAANERISYTHPFGLLASSTHDSKRSEDVRARIDVLSEMPGAWRLALRRWSRLNARRKARVGTEPAPSSNDEYLLYQTLLGVWPMKPPDAAGIAQLADRVDAYMLKATREAKQHTSWMNPNQAYEGALSGFVRRLLTAREHDRFLADFVPFQATVAHFGCLNSLNMLLLKLTVPGVPDIYQGCELWNLSLVDPDNRRPVDFAAARDLLDALQQDFAHGPDPAAVRRLLGDMADGRIKLYLLWRALRARAQYEGPLRHGRYVPLDVSGPAARHVIAFARVDEQQQTVIVIATRLLLGFSGGDPAQVTDAERWARTVVTLPWQRSTGAWRDVIGGRQVTPARIGTRDCVELATVFDAVPLALLVPDGAASEIQPLGTSA